MSGIHGHHMSVDSLPARPTDVFEWQMSGEKIMYLAIERKRENSLELSGL
jgi:hypothetical protein